MHAPSRTHGVIGFHSPDSVDDLASSNDDSSRPPSAISGILSTLGSNLVNSACSVTSSALSVAPTIASGLAIGMLGYSLGYSKAAEVGDMAKRDAVNETIKRRSDECDIDMRSIATGICSNVLTTQCKAKEFGFYSDSGKPRWIWSKL